MVDKFFKYCIILANMRKLKYILNNFMTSRHVTSRHVTSRHVTSFILNFFKQFNYLNFYITEIRETSKSLLLKFKLIYILKNYGSF